MKIYFLPLSFSLAMFASPGAQANPFLSLERATTLQSNEGVGTKGGGILLDDGDGGMVLRDLVDPVVVKGCRKGKQMMGKYPALSSILGKLGGVHPYFASLLRRELEAMEFCFLGTDVACPWQAAVPKYGAHSMGKLAPSFTACREGNKVMVNQAKMAKARPLHAEFLVLHEVLHSFIEAPGGQLRDDHLDNVLGMTGALMENHANPDGEVLAEKMGNFHVYVPAQGGIFTPFQAELLVIFSPTASETQKLAAAQRSQSLVPHLLPFDREVYAKYVDYRGTAEQLALERRDFQGFIELVGGKNPQSFSGTDLWVLADKAFSPQLKRALVANPAMPVSIEALEHYGKKRDKTFFKELLAKAKLDSRHFEGKLSRLLKRKLGEGAWEEVGHILDAFPTMSESIQLEGGTILELLVRQAQEDLAIKVAGHMTQMPGQRNSHGQNILALAEAWELHRLAEFLSKKWPGLGK